MRLPLLPFAGIVMPGRNLPTVVVCKGKPHGPSVVSGAPEACGIQKNAWVDEVAFIYRLNKSGIRSVTVPLMEVTSLQRNKTLQSSTSREKHPDRVYSIRLNELASASQCRLNTSFNNASCDVNDNYTEEVKTERQSACNCQLDRSFIGANNIRLCSYHMNLQWLSYLALPCKFGIMLIAFLCLIFNRS